MLATPFTVPPALHLPVAAPAPTARWIAAGCALLIWALGLLAVSPQLHGALHQDATHAGHTCAVTLFNDGVDDSSGCADLSVAPVLFPAGETLALATVPAADAHDRLPPACGPPLR